MQGGPRKLSVQGGPRESPVPVLEGWGGGILASFSGGSV